MNPFPWDNAIGFGLGVLRLAPDQFWAMTPRELNAAFVAFSKRRGVVLPPGRADLERLMDKFPDKELGVER